jgi:hypothetical protein
MRQCDLAVQTDVWPEGVGSGVTVVVNQDDSDPGGWILRLYALFDGADNHSRVFVGATTLAVPNTTTRLPTRVVMSASMPGVYRYQVQVTAPQIGTTQPTKPLLVGCFCGDASANAFNAST